MYSDLSVNLTKKISKTEKKNNGIYFTPLETIRKNIQYIEPFMKNIKEVLEPSCGSCGYILELQKYKANITGVENNDVIYESVKSMENENVKLVRADFLNHELGKKFDLIIGNPPYFVMKKNDVDESYYKYFEGRPNIFILFIIKSLSLLNENGILSFVLPNNFLNSLYYEKTRKFIIDHYRILNIVDCDDDYIDTKQDTIIIVIQNKKCRSQRFRVNYANISDYTIFGIDENIAKLKSLRRESSTLSSLGFSANIGTVVWNQCKEQLTDDDQKTRLIYSSDIEDNKLTLKEYSNKDKKNFIDKEANSQPVLVVNRGYGVGSYNFSYCIIDMETDFLIENHLICIKYNEQISRGELIDKYNHIVKSFEDERTMQFIELYFGNNAINSTELINILPIYD